MRLQTVVILGPTASGKSALALQLAQKLPCEIISLDSALIYQGMDIGTAKPSQEELSLCPHHLIDIISPDKSYSAANFASDCVRLVAEIEKRGNLSVICGGTMMYYKALVEGLSPLPPTDEETRKKVNALGTTHGWPYVHGLLKEVDPVSATKLNPNDRQRVSRALEVFYMTKRPMSSFFEGKKDVCPFSRLEIVLLPKNQDRTLLREQIKQRFLKMLEQGLIDEVKKLKEKNLDPDLPAMRAVGYRQVLQYLNGEVTYDEMIELSVIATARLAKHQMTWLRGGLNDPTATLLTSHNQGALAIESEAAPAPHGEDEKATSAENTGNHGNTGDTGNAENVGNAVKVKRFYLEIEDPHKEELMLSLVNKYVRPLELN